MACRTYNIAQITPIGYTWAVVKLFMAAFCHSLHPKLSIFSPCNDYNVLSLYKLPYWVAYPTYNTIQKT